MGSILSFLGGGVSGSGKGLFWEVVGGTMGDQCVGWIHVGSLGASGSQIMPLTICDYLLRVP